MNDAKQPQKPHDLFRDGMDGDQCAPSCWCKRASSLAGEAAQPEECQHFVICGNDAGGWWCGDCNKTLTRYYVNKYVRGRK